MIKIAPSILSADFGCLAHEAKRAEDAGADLLHVDVMDGNFVPNITIGPMVIAALRKSVQIPIEAHLMICNPDRYVKSFASAGSGIITVHVESCDIERLIPMIKSLGVKAGVSLNPDTPLSSIEPMLDKIDMVLVMSVNPGFSGQKFMNSVLHKIKRLRSLYERDIEIDGGINLLTAKEAVLAGANMLVAGTYLFGSKNMGEAIKSLRNVAIEVGGVQ